QSCVDVLLTGPAAGALVTGDARADASDLADGRAIRGTTDEEAGLVAGSIIRPAQVDLAGRDGCRRQVTRRGRQANRLGSVMGGKHTLQRWGVFQRGVIILTSPAIGVVEGRIGDHGAPGRKDLLLLADRRQ